MSVSQSSPLVAPVTVVVAPTETTLCSFARDTLKGAKRVTVQVYNANAAQTFVGVVYRRKTGMSAWAPSTIGDFASVGPLTSVMADLDVEGTDELELRGTMSGAGGNVQVGATRKAATP
jgi:hypothetical protein